MVERIVLLSKICPEYVKPAIMIIVSYGHTHAALLATVLVDCRTRAKSDLLERAVAIVVVQERRGRVVGN